MRGQPERDLRRLFVSFEPFLFDNFTPFPRIKIQYILIDIGRFFSPEINMQNFGRLSTEKWLLEMLVIPDNHESEEDNLGLIVLDISM